MMPAQYPGTCSRCHGPITPGDRIVIRKRAWLHPTCAPGADEGSKR